jgi:hypothetical protein
MTDHSQPDTGQPDSSPEAGRAAVDAATLEAAAVETYLASQADDAGTDGADGTDDSSTDTQGAPAVPGDATPDGDVVQPLGGTLSGEEDYVVADPAGLSGEQTAALTADEETGRAPGNEADGEVDTADANDAGDVGAMRHGSGGR